MLKGSATLVYKYGKVMGHLVNLGKDVDDFGDRTCYTGNKKKSKIGKWL